MRLTPRGISGHGGAIGGGHGGDGVIGRWRRRSPRESRFSIERERSYDLREVPGSQAAQAIHLPEAVLRGGVTLREESIVERFGADMWRRTQLSRVTVTGRLKKVSIMPEVWARDDRHTNKQSPGRNTTAAAMSVLIYFRSRLEYTFALYCAKLMKLTLRRPHAGYPH